MDEAEQQITDLLESELFELFVEEIAPHPNRPRADLRAFDQSKCEYLLEVKTRATERDFHAELQARGVAVRAVPSGYSNRMSGIIRKAAQQLLSTPSVGEPFRLVAFVSLQQDSHQRDVDASQFRATLYGVVDLAIQRDENSSIELLPCFYFTYAAFVRYPQIDGAILL